MVHGQSNLCLDVLNYLGFLKSEFGLRLVFLGSLPRPPGVAPSL